MVRSETLTLVLVNLAGIMERADQSLLPGVYKEVGAALHADPTRLGSLTLFRSIVQTTCYPLAAYLASRHNRAHVIAVGAFLWSAATFLVAFSSTFFQVAVSRGLNGIGLALAIPSIQSLVADSTEDHNRGTAFGWLQVTGNIGSILGYICSVLIAPTTFMGIPGWRVSFHLVGAISVIVGILVACFANDPHFIKNNKRDINITSTKSLWVEFKDVLSQAKSVLKIPTFQVLIAQGVPGAFPGSALSFLAMWLELMGFSHKTTALLLTLSTIGSCFGGIFGGKVGDALSLRMPNAGRIIMSQISASSIIPTSAVLLLVLPRYDSATAVSYGLVLFVLGLLASWTTAATNYPIFAEIVPEKQRTIVYALDQTLENVLASFAPPIVGILAQNVYGYDPTRKAELMSIDRENAWTLARALYAAILTPMIICVSVYSFLYCTYPRDRERARMEALIESEMGVMMKSDDVIFVSKLKEKVVVEGIDDEIECYEKLGLEENNVGVICVDIDLDDSDDERRLLSNHIRN